MTKDVVERLRAWADPIERGYEVPAAGLAIREAAGLIERQEAELTRLRALVTPQPIETAPRDEGDEHDILLYVPIHDAPKPIYMVRVGFRPADFDEPVEWVDDEGDPIVGATFWARIPTVQP